MSPPPSIHPDLKALFEFTRSRVTEDDIWSKEAHLPGRKDGRFLFCVTVFDTFEAEWTDLLAKLEHPENDPNIARVMDLFAGGGR